VKVKVKVKVKVSVEMKRVYPETAFSECGRR